AAAYLDSEYTDDPAERERIHNALLAERDVIVSLGPKYLQIARSETPLMELLERALTSHSAAVERGEASPAGPPKILREE
ncbi:MAG: TerC family protein, partial [Actinomycetes bacterium]